MRHPGIAWWAAWRRRTSAWGAWLDGPHIVLAALTLQPSGSVRVAVWGQQPAPREPRPAETADPGFVEPLRAASARVPRRARTLALAVHERECRQGVFQSTPGLPARQLAAEVQLEAAGALGLAPEEVGFDFDVADPEAEAPLVHWAACSRQQLRHWQDHARRAGWRLPAVEPEAQAARRALDGLRGEERTLWAQSPQDWQFERAPVRSLSDDAWAHMRPALQVSPQWGPLVACGAALGLMA